MPKKIVAGNWKMNMDFSRANDLMKNLNKEDFPGDVEVMVFPPSILVQSVAGNASGGTRVGVQNFYVEEAGAFTGEIAIPQVKSVGGSVGLIGHSERRSLFGEDHSFLKAKVDAAIEHGFDFIFCCGEPLEVREAGEEFNYVKQQLEESLFHVSKEQMTGGVIAYEPVWAIGTGKTASSQQAEDMHAKIREWLNDKYDLETAMSVSILYGGSCKPENAKELFDCPNVDGGLIGGASLKADSFAAIVNAF